MFLRLLSKGVLEFAKLLLMMNIYIAKPFAAGSSLHKPIAELKQLLSKWNCYQWEMIALPHTKELLEESYKHEQPWFMYILQRADVLIVDTGLIEYSLDNPNLPLFAHRADYRILLIVCSQSATPVAPDFLNIGIDRNNTLLLEYKYHINELEGYIFNEIARHSIFLQTTKPLQT